MKIISYYELLKMIKNGNIPKKVNYKITGYLENYVEYTAQYDRNDFTHYELTNHHREDENIHFYLNENFLESDMFDESILILEEQKKIPEKLDYCEENTFMIKYKENSYLTREEIRLLDSNFKELGNKINEIIDYLKSKGE